MPGGLPLTERLERAFAARVSDLPDATRLVLLVAALSDGDAISEILEAAAVVAGTPLDLDAAEPAVEAALIDLDVNSIRFRHPLMRSAVRQSAGVQQRRRVHEALAATLDADPDRRVWHRAALISGTHEELARELEAAGSALAAEAPSTSPSTALQRAVQLSAPEPPARRMFATAELAYERGRPDIALPLLRELERLDLEPLRASRERASSASSWMPVRWRIAHGCRADRHRRAGRRGGRSRAAPQPAVDRRRAHVVVEPGPGHPAADRGRRRSRGTARRRGSAAGLDPRLRRSARQRAEGPRLPARRRGQRRDGRGARRGTWLRPDSSPAPSTTA